MHRVKGHAGAPKPVADLADVLPVGVIEVAARSKYLDRFSPAGNHSIQQSGMEPLRSRINQGGHCPAHQKPTAFPSLRPSLAPNSSPVFSSTAMHSASPQYPWATLILCPMCSRIPIVSGEMPVASTMIWSGIH